MCDSVIFKHLYSLVDEFSYINGCPVYNITYWTGLTSKQVRS